MPKPAPRAVVAFDDREEPDAPPPVQPPEPDAAAEPAARDAPASVNIKVELRAIKRLLAKIMTSRDPAQRRKVACEVAREIDQHAFAAQSVPDPKELTGDTLHAYRGEADSLAAIAEDMVEHCKNTEADGIDLDLEQMPSGVARFLLLVRDQR